MRTGILAAVSLLLIGFVAGGQDGAPTRKLYIGTYTTNGSKGIYLSQFDERNGKLSVPTLAASAVDPSFLAFHPRLPFLYAVNESTAQVSSFAVSPDSGELKLLSQAGTGGDGPCHLALDASGRMLLVANYGGGSFAGYPVLPDGRIGPRVSMIKFTGKGQDPKRQASPHAHSAYFTADNRFVLIDDLGTDRTMVYRVHPETAGVDPAMPPFGKANPGAGPRHLVASPDHRFVYVLNELQSTVTRFTYNTKNGEMRNVDSVSALPSGFQGKSSAAEIAMGPGGHWLIVSNRGDNSLVVFKIAADGKLLQIQRIASGGRTPRSFSLDPTFHWLLSANQESGNIAIFPLDPSTGHLGSSIGSVDVPSPVCLLFR